MLSLFSPRKNTQSREPRFQAATEFSNLNLLINTLKDKQGKILNDVKNIIIENYKKGIIINETSIDQKKYNVITEIINTIDQMKAHFNEQSVPQDEDYNKLDKLQLAGLMFSSILEAINTNLEVLATPRDARKATTTVLTYCGMVAGAAAAATMVSLSWPLILLSMYASDRGFALGYYVSGTNMLPASLQMLFDIAEEAIKIFDKLRPEVSHLLENQQNQDYNINHYEVLELSFGASIEDVTKAYRQLALKYHPDKHTNNNLESTAKFIAITNAYKFLTDPQLKDHYDQRYEHEPPKFT